MLGAFVLKQACHEAATWPGEVSVAVNLSPLQFSNNALAEEVQSVLQASGLRPDRLELEITESVLLEDHADNQYILEKLRQTGARVVLDDFGAGYNTLNYLQTFAFSKIKIDRSFIQGLEDKAASQALSGLSSVFAGI